MTRVTSCIEECGTEGSPTNKTVTTSLFGNRDIERSRDREIAIRLTASNVLDDAVVPYLLSCIHFLLSIELYRFRGSKAEQMVELLLSVPLSSRSFPVVLNRFESFDVSKTRQTIGR